MMTAERFRQIRNLFEAALDRPTVDRPVWLEDACMGDADLRNEVEALLTHYRQRSLMVDKPVVDLFSPAGVDVLSRWEGRRVGAWEILREIGRGGMATVYLARRADDAFSKQAAI